MSVLGQWTLMGPQGIGLREEHRLILFKFIELTLVNTII